jgi:hypothetical protein
VEHFDDALDVENVDTAIQSVALTVLE